MGRRRKHSDDPINRNLREAEAALAQGRTVKDVCRQLEVTEQTHYRWRREFGGLQVDQAKRLRDLERENGRLKKIVSEQALDISILREAASGTSERAASSARGRARARATGGRVGATRLHGARASSLDAAPSAARRRSCDRHSPAIASERGKRAPTARGAQTPLAVAPIAAA